MLLAELKRALSTHADRTLRFRLPTGQLIPAHAHVTEIARVEKQFVDCGGQHHREIVCRLQLWVAKDIWHRFTAAKLLAILNQAEPVLQGDDLPVDVEYEVGVVTQSPVEDLCVIDGDLVVILRARHTACLAKERRTHRAGLFRSWNLFRRARGQPG